MSTTTMETESILAIYMCGHIKTTTSSGPVKSCKSSKIVPVVVRTTSACFLTTDVCPMCSLTGIPKQIIPFGRVRMTTQVRLAFTSLTVRLFNAETLLGISEHQKLNHSDEPISHGLDKSAVIVMADFARNTLSLLQQRSVKAHVEAPHLSKDVLIQSIEDLEKCAFKVRRLEAAANAYAEGRCAAAGTFHPLLKEHIKHSLSLGAMTCPDPEPVVEDCRTEKEKLYDPEALPEWFYSDADGDEEDLPDCGSHSHLRSVWRPFASLTPTPGSPPPCRWEKKGSRFPKSGTFSNGHFRPHKASCPPTNGVRGSFDALDSDARPFYHWPSRRARGNVPAPARRGSHGPSWPPLPPSPSALPLPPTRMS